MHRATAERAETAAVPLEIDEPLRERKRGITIVTPDPNSTESVFGDVPRDAPRSRWHTAEFYVYYVVAGIMVPYMIWVPMRLSQCA